MKPRGIAGGEPSIGTRITSFDLVDGDRLGAAGIILFYRPDLEIEVDIEGLSNAEIRHGPIGISGRQLKWINGSLKEAGSRRK